MGKGLERNQMFITISNSTVFSTFRATSQFSNEYYVIGVHDHKTGDNQVAIVTINKHIMECMNKYNEVVAEVRKGFSHHEVHFDQQSVNASQNPAVDRCHIPFFVSDHGYQVTSDDIYKFTKHLNKQYNLFGTQDELPRECFSTFYPQYTLSFFVSNVKSYTYQCSCINLKKVLAFLIGITCRPTRKAITTSACAHYGKNSDESEAISELLAHTHETALRHYNVADFSSAVMAQEAIIEMSEDGSKKEDRFREGKNRFRISDSRTHNSLMQKSMGNIADMLEQVRRDDKLLNMKIKYDPKKEKYIASDTEEEEITEEEHRRRGGAGYHDGSKLKRLADGKEAHEQKTNAKLNKEQVIHNIIKHEVRAHDTLHMKDIPIEEIPPGMTAKQIVDTFK